MQSIRNAALGLGCLMLVGATMQSTAGSAQESAANPSLAARIADGRPWRMRMENGRKTTLVLLANGTGTMMGGTNGTLAEMAADRRRHVPETRDADA